MHVLVSGPQEDDARGCNDRRFASPCEVSCRWRDFTDERNGPALFGHVGQVDLLLASPECTSHSIARGRREVDLASLRSGLFVLPFLDAWQPRFLVLENVARIRCWEGWRDFLAALGARGYRHTIEILDAQFFGVPQARRRMFLLGTRDGVPTPVMGAQRRASRSATSILDPDGVHPAGPIHGRARPLAAATLERIARADRSPRRGAHHRGLLRL